MKIIYIAWNTIQRNIRDRKTLTVSILLPIVLILILGNALKDVYTTKDIGKTAVCYVNNDSGNISANFNDFLNVKDIKDMLEVKKAGSYDEGVKLVNDGKVKALIYINKGYSDEIKNGNKGKIEIYTSKNNSVSLAVVQNIIDSYNDGANTVTAASNIAKAQVKYVESDNINDKYLTVEGKTPRAIDYYAVTMLVLTLMYGASYGCSELDKVFFKNIGLRIKTTATKTYEHLLGILFGAISTLVLQALVLIGFTKFFYGVNWGGNPLMIFLTILALSILSISIGVMFASLTGNSEKGSSLLQIIIPICTFVSGGYVKIQTDNELFAKIRYFVPNQLAHTSLFNTIYNGSKPEAQQCIIAMLGLAGIAFIIAVISERRRVA